MIFRVIIVTLLVVIGSILFAYALDQQSEGGFWWWLGNIGAVMGIVSFVPIVYAVWEYVQYKRREEEERQHIHSQVGTMPGVLIISIGGSSIRNEVEAYLKKQESFKDFDFDSRVFMICRESKHIKASDIDAIIHEVDENLDVMRMKAVDKIHLFIKGPVTLGTMVGEVLANRTSTLVYNYQANIGYENWGSLHR